MHRGLKKLILFMLLLLYSVAAFLATTPLLTENASTNGVGSVFYSKTIDLSSFAGQPQIYIAFRHHDSEDMFSLHIDDVSVSAAPTAVPSCKKKKKKKLWLL